MRVTCLASQMGPCNVYNKTHQSKSLLHLFHGHSMPYKEMLWKQQHPLKKKKESGV